MGFVRYASAPSFSPASIACGSRRAAVSMMTDGPAAAPRAQPPQDLDAVDAGHRHVEQDELGLALVHLPQRLDAALRRADLVAVLGEDGLVEGERVREVVDDEHVAAGVAHRRERGTVVH